MDDTDFRGADPELDDEPQPGVLACDPTAKPGEIATVVRRINAVADDLSETVFYVPTVGVNRRNSYSTVTDRLARTGGSGNSGNVTSTVNSRSSSAPNTPTGTAVSSPR